MRKITNEDLFCVAQEMADRYGLGTVGDKGCGNAGDAYVSVFRDNGNRQTKKREMWILAFGLPVRKSRSGNRLQDGFRITVLNGRISGAWLTRDRGPRTEQLQERLMETLRDLTAKASEDDEW